MSQRGSGGLRMGSSFLRSQQAVVCDPLAALEGMHVIVAVPPISAGKKTNPSSVHQTPDDGVATQLLFEISSVLFFF